MAAYQTNLDSHKQRFLEELLEFLRIPSISALPERAEDVARAGDWVAQRLTAAGVENVEVLPTGGHPVVYGDWLHAPGKPTVMIYGHFDVQPVDPVELWTHPPFEPTIIGDRVYARGASDDKGNMLAPILAVEALLQGDGAAPVNLKFCFEGQGGDWQSTHSRFHATPQGAICLPTLRLAPTAASSAKLSRSC